MLRRNFMLASAAAFAGTFVLWAELPPQVYRKWQMEAPEAVEIEVKKAIPAAGTRSVTVEVEAIVTKVVRSATKLKPGSTIRISYLHEVHERPIVGPSAVPLLHAGEKCPAFLTRAPGGGYHPAAGGRSFSELIPQP